MSEKIADRANSLESEVMRIEVIRLLQSILGEVTIQAHASTPTLHASAREAVWLYEEMLARLTLNLGNPSPRPLAGRS